MIITRAPAELLFCKGSFKARVTLFCEGLPGICTVQVPHKDLHGFAVCHDMMPVEEKIIRFTIMYDHGPEQAVTGQVKGLYESLKTMLRRLKIHFGYKLPVIISPPRGDTAVITK